MTAPLPSLAEASRAIAAGSLSPVALTEQALARIAALDPSLNAFILVTADRARAAAAAAEAEIKAGRRRGPLHGIPYALKDIYDVAGLRTSCHSRQCLDHVADADAETTRRLEAAGMVLLGKLSTHEFARGGPTDVLPFPNAKNPWDPARFAGGSSSGSGAAVAAGLVAMAMGSDTGGSIRLPAGYCGVVGLKPTYGLVSRRGIFPLSFTLDYAGPLTRSVEDCAMAVQALAGHDPGDPGSADEPIPDYLAALGAGISGLTIGRARAYDIESGVDAETMDALDAACDVLRGLGATVVDVALPSRLRGDAVTQGILLAEAFAIHQDWLRERPHLYGRVTRERLTMGAFVSGAEYVQAQRLRRVITAEVDAVLHGCDAILCAGTTGGAPLLSDVDEGPFRRQHPVTALFNATGHPAIVMPCGFAATGMPLSLSLVAPSFAEARLFRIADAYERATPWNKARPPLPI
ncbi:amidase [Neoroseomonas oryzicola]|uniref:Amidase n=1 Tax=Neoroseomonas oryzicola TaxID=535904 RepID=A0A9X9WF98_9PROT|nr:amidase [Neoroseomonas oryzicola]MBR0659008.1 amidase [Neoroseomonas oryzicola]NKE19742.1 amidase [Neoroseomonas oryzicola]